jgi:hypothetical protein
LLIFIWLKLIRGESMKIVVIFDEPSIKDPDSQEATNAIEILSEELRVMDDRGYDWYIDEVIGDVPDESN